MQWLIVNLYYVASSMSRQDIEMNPTLQCAIGNPSGQDCNILPTWDYRVPPHPAKIVSCRKIGKTIGNPSGQDCTILPTG